MSSGVSVGRYDGTTAGGMQPATKAKLTMALMAAALVAAWHLTVVLTAGVPVRDLLVTVHALMRGHPLSGLTGAHPAGPAVTGLVFAGLLVATFSLFVIYVFTIGAALARGRSAAGFATRAQVREGLGVARARARAAQTRPGLSARERRKAPVSDVGFALGVATAGGPVVLPHEDHLAVVASTGAGKSRDVMIPAALDAPGALVITCTRADILDAVVTHRSTMGRVWVFDPLDRLGFPEPVVWDPVAGCRDGQTAVSRGLAFAAGLAADDKSSTNAGFFRGNAASAMTRLLHAAALDVQRQRTVADVIDWAIHLDDGAEVAQDLIRNSRLPQAEPLWAGLLRSVATGAEETVASSRQTLQQALEPMALRSVLRWVTPRQGVPTFEAAAFVRSRDTLVLAADANASANVAPLCAMLLQEVVDTAKATAARLPGGRIDPPLRLVGDEIANVAPLPKLPDLGTDARGFGMQLFLALQSIAQARRRWGVDGAATLLDNMPAELLLGGLTDTDALKRYSTLVGDVELVRMTTSYGSDGGSTTASESWSERAALRTGEARQIPDRHGLLIYRNQMPVLVRLTPWYERKDGKALSAQQAQAEGRRLSGAETPL